MTGDYFQDMAEHCIFLYTIIGDCQLYQLRMREHGNVAIFSFDMYMYTQECIARHVCLHCG